MKRIFCLGIILCLLLGAAVAEEGAQSSVEDEGVTETIIQQGESPAFVTLLLEVAQGELGYVEGSDGYSKFGEWSGDPLAAWCAEFICWCVNETDARHNLSLLNAVYPNYSGQNTGRDWFIERGRFVYRKGNCPGWGYQWLRGSDRLMQKNEYIPHPGDLMFFSYNGEDTEHVALVEYTARDSMGRVVIHVIEGNNPDRVQRNSYYLDDSQVLGFGACEDVVGTTMRPGNSGDKVVWLQETLYRLGYLDQRHLTGTYGSNTGAAVTAFQQANMPNKNANGIADRETQQKLEALLIDLEFNDPSNWLVSE